jgi:G patch domain-containing protein 1
MPKAHSFQSYGFQTSGSADAVFGPKPTERQLVLESGPPNESGVESQLTNTGKASDQLPGMADIERNEGLETKRPGEAIFKAIFGDEEDDE